MNKFDISIDDKVVKTDLEQEKSTKPVLTREFLTFKNAFDEVFVTKKINSFKYGSYYINKSFYSNGHFNIIYKINDKKYEIKTTIKALKEDNLKKDSMDKLTYLDENAEAKDKLLKRVKDKVDYLVFDFPMFKRVLTKYLFDKNLQDIDIWEINLNLFELIKDKEFMILINKYNKEDFKSFYNLL